MFNKIKKYALSQVGDHNLRDWGLSVTLRTDLSKQNPDFGIYREKFLVFYPEQSIILESHSEHSEVLVSDNDFTYALEDDAGIVHRHNAEKNERVFIPKGRKHKIINPNKLNLNIFEIQVGIIRDDDKKQYSEDDQNV